LSNGLKLIAEELQSYPEIGFEWKEPGIAFRVTFTNKNFKQEHELQPELQLEYDVEAIGHEIGTKLGLSWDQVGNRSVTVRQPFGTKSALSWHQVKEILDFCKNPRPIQNIMELAKWKDRTKFRNKYVKPLIEVGLLEQTIPDKPTSSKQEYFLTAKGIAILKSIKTN